MNKAGIAHVHDDLRDIPERVNSFHSAAEAGQLVAVAELKRRNALLSHPATTTAAAAIIGALTALTGIIGTFVIFQFQTLSNLAIVSEQQGLKYGDEGDTDRAQALFQNASLAIHDTNGVVPLVGFSLGIVAICVVVIVWSRRRSAAQAVAETWLALYAREPRTEGVFPANREKGPSASTLAPSGSRTSSVRRKGSRVAGKKRLS